MPVKVSRGEHLEPFFEHLRNGGTHEVDLGAATGGQELDGGQGEPHYKVRGAEFQKGVVYEDGRMDLCKMVVGPDHIWELMDSLRKNSFVRHFLLGNNIIGPSGATAIATFIKAFPERMETWYLAGNCINGAGFKEIVDGIVASSAATNVWMKRNPLGPGAAADVYRLITQAKNLRTLDLDQTELGNKGVADLFNLLAAYSGPEGSVLPLRNLYLNGCGISTEAAEAMASFLASPHCGLTSLYASCNPLGNSGVQALAKALPNAPNLARLSLQSVGVGTQGAVALCEASAKHTGIRSVDLGQAYATEDLQQAYNYIDDGAVSALCKLVKTCRSLEYLNLAHCPITTSGLLDVSAAILHSSSMLYYFASSVVPDPALKEATFTPSRDLHFPDPSSPPRAEIEANKAVLERLEANVKAKHGPDMTYAEFRSDEKRWLINDKEDVRKIDSVYRNRDAGKARRGQMMLAKNWEQGDDTLARVEKAQLPMMVSGVGA
jgi:Ran GTPase-activating protein (RanGAP) involved in mRNA processing and transport